jgi:imidazolonepropionase-like amidohydrolase
MKRYAAALLLASFTASSHAQQAPGASVVVNRVTVINGTGAPPARDMAVVITGNRIAAIDRADRIKIPAGAQTIDGLGKFVVPGLADMHNHLLPGGPTPTFQDLKPNLQQLLSWGVTTAFAMSVDAASFADLKRAAADDQSPYARFYGVGPGFATLGGSRPNTPDEARAVVRSMKSSGVDAVKIAYDDMSWAVKQGIPVLRPEVMAAIIAEAHANGLKAYVHAPILRYAKEALTAGADGLIHGIVSEPVDDEFIALMKKNGAVYVSTLALFEACADINAWTRRLAAFDDRGAMKQMWTVWENPASAPQFQAFYNGTGYVTSRMPVVRENLKKVFGAGIPIVTGTDTGFPGVVLGASSLMELVLHVEAGVPAPSTIQAATMNAAKMVGRDKELGTVEAGKLADLVVLDADPIADMANLRRIHRVIKGGKVFEPGAVR